MYTIIGTLGRSSALMKFGAHLHMQNNDSVKIKNDTRFKIKCKETLAMDALLDYCSLSKRSTNTKRVGLKTKKKLLVVIVVMMAVVAVGGDGDGGGGDCQTLVLVQKST